jgi:hypothetical protein
MLALRLASGLFAALFLLGAIVQINDPDPLRWMLLYLAAAALRRRPAPPGRTPHRP